MATSGESDEIDTEALLRKPIWTVEDASRFFSIPIATIYKQRSVGQFCPGYRVGKHLRFKRDELLAWFESLRDEA